MHTHIDFKRLDKLTNKWIQNIWFDRTRHIVCKGGGGSGKSYGIAQLLVYRIIAEPGHKLLVVRQVANTLRESCFALIKEVISLYGCNDLFTINKSDMTIECKNGNKIIFRGMDDPEKIKSIQGITDIWIEEASEILVESYRQLNIRLRGQSKYPLQMFITFNPISIMHWLKREFFDSYKRDCLVIETTYKDNKFLDEQAKQVLEDFKETDEYFYMVYALGQWGVVGKTIFPARIVSQRIEQLLKYKPLKKGYFTYELRENGSIDNNTIRFIDDDKGYIEIYEEPKEGYPYVIGGDTSGEGSDYFVGDVIDNVSGIQVAQLYHQMDEDLYTMQVYCLGIYYNKALVSIEANFSTYPNKILDKVLHYPLLYTRESMDTYTGALKKSYGFRTTTASRPVLISNLVKIVRENCELINCMGTLEEMLTFVRNEHGKAEAIEGSHDDRIISLGIAYLSREQQRSYLIEAPVEKKEKLINSLTKKK